MAKQGVDDGRIGQAQQHVLAQRVAHTDQPAQVGELLLPTGLAEEQIAPLRVGVFQELHEDGIVRAIQAYQAR